MGSKKNETDSDVKLDPKTVEIYISPFIPGYRSERYCGPVQVTGHIAYDQDREARADKLEALLLELRTLAAERNCNTIVGTEIAVDPYVVLDGNSYWQIEIAGTASFQVSMF